jgi:hypothetical protein
MWDSAKTAISSITNGSRSTDISYAGTTLSLNGTTYYWRIRFWDNKGAVGNWSQTASFTMSGNPFSPTYLKTDGMENPTWILYQQHLNFQHYIQIPIVIVQTTMK